MRPLVTAALLSAVAALLGPANASAVLVAPGSDGRAFMTWPSDEAGLQFAERTASGRVTAARTIAPSRTFPILLTSGPGRAATVLATDYSIPEQRTLVARRGPAAQSFEQPEPFTLAVGFHVLSSDSNARGDAAVLAKAVSGPLTLLTSKRGGPLRAAHELTTSREQAAVAIDREGRIVLAYFAPEAPQGVRARFGGIDSPLGPAQALTAGPAYTNVATALDDAGNATIAFVGNDPSQPERPAELVVSRAGPDERFGAARVVARGAPAIMGAGFATFRIAAAGRTTALAFQSNAGDGRLGVAIARGSGRFDVQRPTTPRLGLFSNQPFNPSVAVDRAGDVLLAYNFGIYGDAVHATQRRAGRKRFGRPRALSSLGQGGGPVAALLDDRTPLVAWDDGHGRFRYRTNLAGRAPDLTPPRAIVTLPANAEARLRERNTLAVAIRCSEACLMSARGTLKTPTGRTMVFAPEAILRRGAKVVRRFAFDPAQRAGRARDGSTLRVTVEVENASGASHVVSEMLRLR